MTCRTQLLPDDSIGPWALLGAVTRLFWPPSGSEGAIDFEKEGIVVGNPPVHILLRPGAIMFSAVARTFSSVSMLLQGMRH